MEKQVSHGAANFSTETLNLGDEGEKLEVNIS
jgi:hypothetical protein